MSKEMPNVVFLKVDVDQSDDISQEYGISCMPTFKLIKNGQAGGPCCPGTEDLRLTLVKG